MKTLIIAEHNNQQLKASNDHITTAALQLSSEYDVIVVGYDCQTVVDSAIKLPHAKTVYVADHTVYTHQLAENTAAVVAEVAKNYDYVLTAATTFGKNLLPRVAALLDESMISDVVKIISTDTFIRPIYAGNAMATVKSEAKTKCLTIRTTGFASSPPTKDKPLETDIQLLTQVIDNQQSRFEKQTLTQSSRPELTAARVVVAGGRGLKSADNFQLLEEIADKLGAAVGASRAAVDAGFAPNDYQVGQTGKVVAPDLYIAVGISGAIQHLAGMKDSKVIVAINSDSEAPIFQLADYGLVGDLFKILPELSAELTKSGVPK